MVGAGHFNGNRCNRLCYRLFGMLWRNQGKLMHGTHGKIQLNKYSVTHALISLPSISQAQFEITSYVFEHLCFLISSCHFSVFQFSLLLVVIILFEIGIGAFGYANKDELNAALDKGFNKTLHDYEINKDAWNMVQTEVCKPLIFIT